MEVWRRLSQILTKNVVAQTSPVKMPGTKKRTPVKLDRNRKLLFLFLRKFLAATAKV